MKSPSLGKKPSKQHILWTVGDGDVKRFHEERLREWCRRLGFDFDTYTRVDHDRGDESRRQYQCVFSYAAGGDSVEFGGEEWTIRTESVPRTFVELDEDGQMRVHGWSTERVLDVRELRHRGPRLVVRAADADGPLRLDARELTD